MSIGIGIIHGKPLGILFLLLLLASVLLVVVHKGSVQGGRLSNKENRHIECDDRLEM